MPRRMCVDTADVWVWCNTVLHPATTGDVYLRPSDMTADGVCCARRSPASPLSLPVRAGIFHPCRSTPLSRRRDWSPVRRPYEAGGSW